MLNNNKLNNITSVMVIEEENLKNDIQELNRKINEKDGLLASLRSKMKDRKIKEKIKPKTMKEDKF